MLRAVCSTTLSFSQLAALRLALPMGSAAGLIASLLLRDRGTQIALSGVSQKALRSSVSVRSPPVGRA